MSRPRLIALLLALGTLAVFLPAGSFQFVNYDDGDYVTGNPMVQAGWTLAGLKWAFTAGYANNWHPLTWLSHMTDCELFKLHAGAHHFVNVLLHAANTALLFILLLRLTGKIWPAAFVAGLFAWHPQHVESVAWVAERKDVLSAFFALLALLSYAKFAQRNSRRDFWCAVIFFALGLLAKPMLVTLPFVLLLLDFWPLKRVASCEFQVAGSEAPNLQPATRTRTLFQLVCEKWPFFLLTGLSCVITFMAQAKAFHGSGAVTPLDIVPLSFRLGNLPLAYTGYLRHFLWPANLAVFYPLPKMLLIPVVAADTLILLAVSAVAWRWRKSRPYFGVGWLWFLGMLVPVSGVVMVGGASLADRYSYLPLVGIFIILAFAASEFVARFPVTRWFMCAGAVGVLTGCIFATEKQLAHWQNSETLFRHDLDVVGDNEIAHNNLGFTLEALGDLAGALEQYQAAVRLAPLRASAHSNLAGVLDKLGRPADALAEYRAASRLQPRDPALHTGVANELNRLGQFDAALVEFAIVEQLDPQNPWPHVEAAEDFFKLGRDADGVNEFRAALRLTPDDYQILAEAACYLAANQNVAARDGKNALALALRANALSGHVQPMVFDALGMALAENGDFTNAQTCAQNALTLAAAARMKDLEPLRQRLQLYKNKQPWRESFRATNAPVKNLPEK